MVERDLAKVEVAGSSPVIRSTKCGYELKKFVSAFNLKLPPSGCFPTIRRHSQAVRQRSAKPSSPVRFRVAPPTQNAPKWVRFLRWRCHPITKLGSAWCPHHAESGPVASRSRGELAHRRRSDAISHEVRNSGLVLTFSLGGHATRVPFALEARLPHRPCSVCQRHTESGPVASRSRGELAHRRRSDAISHEVRNSGLDLTFSLGGHATRVPFPMHASLPAEFSSKKSCNLADCVL